MKTYKVPAMFFSDHLSRFLGEGAWEEYDQATEKKSGRCVIVTLTGDQASELLSDAKFYAKNGGDFEPEYRGLMRSAAATVRAMSKG